MIKKIIKSFVIILIILILIMCYSRFIATKRFITKEFSINDEKILEDFDGIKIVHFSDLHYKRVISKKMIDKIIKEINLINPDIVFFTGDLIDEDSDIDDNDINYLSNTLEKINSKYGKYAVIGNHDYSIDIKKIRNIYEKANFTLLENSSDVIYSKNNQKIDIIGISTGEFNESILDKFITNDNDMYKILVLHEPDYISYFDDFNINLALAGHSHNGQVNIPFFKNLFLPNGSKKYYDEYYKVGSTDLYISSGIGVSRYNFRLFNPPSINFYRINKI